MKKEIQSVKKNRTMATKSVPKNIQHILSAITDYIVKIVVDVSNEDDIEEVQLIVDMQKAKILIESITIELLENIF